MPAVARQIGRILALAIPALILGAGPMPSTRPSNESQKPQAFKATVTKEVGCRYWLYLPEGYDGADDKWPLVLFLHGAGERGDDLAKVKIHGPPGLVEKGRSFPFILVSPQCPQGDVWDPDVLNRLLDEVIAKYRVDEDKVYCTGLSMGGYGTWDLAIAHPERFAAIVPICGGGNFIRASRLRHVPVWAFHGAKDPVVPLSESQRMVEAVKRNGGDARLTIYPEAGHDSWSETYRNDEVYRWLLQHKRSRTAGG